MVQEALLEDLLVQPGAVEARLHGQFDVADEGLVGGGGHQPVRVPALVEDEALEAGPAVEEHGLALDTDGAQARVALHGVGRLAVGVQEFEAEAVQEGVLRAPLAAPVLREGQVQAGCEVEVGAHLGAADLARLVAEDGAHAVAGAVGRQGQFDGEGGARQVGGDPGAAQVGVGDRFRPHRLPDAGGAGVVAVVVGVLDRLLAPGLWSGLRVAGADGDLHLAARGGEIAEVGGEGGEAAAVADHLGAVHPDRRVVVDGAEVQQHPAARPRGGRGESAPVPDGLQEVGVADAGECGLGGEGHEDLAAEFAVEESAFEAAVPLVGLELPGPVQVEPVATDELRSRVLRAGDGGGVHRDSSLMVVAAGGVAGTGGEVDGVSCV